MNGDEIYNAWKEKKHQIDISESFADEVMNQVYQYEQARGKPKFDVQWLIDVISSHSFAKVGLVAASAVIGLIRVAFVVFMFLEA